MSSVFFRCFASDCKDTEGVSSSNGQLQWPLKELFVIVSNHPRDLNQAGWQEKLSEHVSLVQEDYKTGVHNNTYRAAENDRNSIRQTAATDANPTAVMYCRVGDKSERKYQTIQMKKYQIV